ncbi:N-acetylneuraminate lyase-like [Leptopilina boulardi]|uniref:N-acetylneuraminate lyase-like n=1 Tax=Leptopilina boulardi TaxID=63433 RepID=UPI0021F6128A|nr:N-acetylneuraminate lyase-like [Leptopilina boulardi]
MSENLTNMPNVELKFRGLIAPVFTPYNNDNSQTINLSIITQYAEYLAKKGINGVLVGGTSGEGTSLSLTERKLISEEWAKAVKKTKQHLMIQIGGAPLPDVLELAKHAESLKVDSLLCLPELYFKPSSVENLINYMEIVSNAAPKTPLLYYHIPMFTNVNIHMGNFLEIIGEKVPTFCGIKFTSSNLDEGAQALKANNGRFAIFLGNDQLISAACSMGMDSFIVTTLNIFPEFSLKILESWKNNDFKTAQKTQEKLSKAVHLISKHGNWVETMKFAMNYLSPLNMGNARSPLKRLSQESEMSMKFDLLNFEESL